MTGSLGDAVRASQLSFRALFNWSTPSMYIGTLLIAPIGQMLFFALLGQQLGVADFQFYVYANSVFAAAKVGLFGAAMCIGNERRYGTLALLVVAPIGPVRLCATRLAPFVVHGIVAGLVSLAVGVVVFEVPVGYPVGLVMQVPIFAVAAFSVGALGLIVGVVGLVVRDIFVATNVFQVLLLLFAGVQIPVEMLPVNIQAIAVWVPCTHAVVASRLAADGDLAASGPELAAEIVMGLFLFGAAILAYVTFRGLSRRRGLVDGL